MLSVHKKTIQTTTFKKERKGKKQLNLLLCKPKFWEVLYPGDLRLTCPAKSSHSLHHSSPQVEGSSLRSVPNHGKLPWHIVHRQRVRGELKRKQWGTRIITQKISSNTCFCSLTCMNLLTDLILDFPHDVQIWQTRFHHQHVGSFPHVSLLQNRSTMRPPAQVSGRHLWQKCTNTNRLTTARMASPLAPGGSW